MKCILQLLWSTLLLLSVLSFISFHFLFTLSLFCCLLTAPICCLFLCSDCHIVHFAGDLHSCQLSSISPSLSPALSLSLSPPLNTWQFRAKWNVSMSWFMYFTMRSSAAPPLLVPSASHPMQSPSAAASSSCLFSDGTFHCCYLCFSCCLSHFVWTDLNVS